MDARTTRRTAPQFVFAHRTSFDRKDLHLIEAFGQAASGHPDSALAAGDSIEASGILAQEPATWRVGGIDFESFEAAVFAFLATLSDRYSG